MKKLLYALMEWRWWLVLPYALIVMLPLSLIQYAGSLIEKHEHIITRPSEWALRHLRKRP